MTFVFISNYLTLHQIPFCDAMYRALGNGFLFISTIPMEQERVAMGWQNEQNYPYEVNIQETGVQQKIDEADVAMIGSTEDCWIQNRLHNGKPIIRYSERVLKQGRWHILSPRALKNMFIHHTAYRHLPVYLLCAGAYAAGDYHLFGAYRHKSYRWGYFPPFMPYTEEQIAENKNNAVTEILWAGRLIDWKHPELVVAVADYLHRKGYPFHMTIIGEGEQEKMVRHLIERYGLLDCVTLLGFMKPEKVRGYMEKANIFLFTSDFQEGWGAVLNESMNSGCAVVASHGIGAVPFLLRDGDNGLIFKNGDTADLCAAVESLITTPSYMRAMGIRAYYTIAQQWNADNAAQRLLQVAAALMAGDTFPEYEDGPLSVAKYLPHCWYSPRRRRKQK